MRRLLRCSRFCFFFNDTATTEIYTLSLHDALPILGVQEPEVVREEEERDQDRGEREHQRREDRSEEHTSELQSHVNIVCRLLLEKKNKANPASQLEMLTPLQMYQMPSDEQQLAASS